MRVNKAIFICCILLFLAGCWDKNEINDLAVVLAAGIEKDTNDTIRLSLQIKTPVPQGTSIAPVEVKQGSGKTIFDAMEELQERVPRKIFWGHNEAIFISEELAKEGIREHLDFFARYVEVRLRNHIFITKNKILDIMNIKPIFATSTGEITKKIAHLESGLSVDIRKLLVMMSSDVETAAIPWVEIEEELEELKQELRVNGIAIFKHNKMIDYINDELTRGVLWVRDEIKSASVTIQPSEAENKYISFELIKSETKVIPTYKDGKWKVLLKIITEDDVVQNQTKLNVMEPSTRKKLEKKIGESIVQRIHSMLEIIQKNLGADILNIGEAIHRKYPKKWKEIKSDWEEVFRDLHIDIETEVMIERPGSSTKPIDDPKLKGEER